MVRSSSFVVRAGALAATAVAVFAIAGGPAAASDPVVTSALGFVAGQQRPDGGFGAGESGFAGFETPDAVLAIADAAQVGASWSPADALAAVQAVTAGGHSALHYLDDWADGAYGAIGAGPAARIAFVASALGLDPKHFDPDGDGGADLIAKVHAGEHADHTWGAGALNTTLAAVLAFGASGAEPVCLWHVDAITALQEPSGSWNYQGDPNGTDADPDTTGLAVEVLTSAGVAPTRAPIAAALAFLARAQDAHGAWHDSYADQANPNSTAVAALAIRAAGYDPATSAWRDAVAPELSGSAYHSPLAWLAAQQAADGHIASPNDDFGLNTFGTTQSVQALVPSQYLPHHAATDCGPDPTTTTTVAPTTTTMVPATSTSGSSTTVSEQGTTSTTAASATSASSSSSSSSTSGSGSTLPVTGPPKNSGRAMAVALGLLVLGAGLTAVGRARRRAA